ncbi:oligosaccharide flippase family protein [Pseudoalteromonas sp. XMcav11-Q]|uniref:lipopolysaccharide biosynthesis protein n=1 Tax=Pseudoalteromonas sp. XMcav11-Q TaxID=3136665 RepID=UPI0032C46891
MLKQATLLVVGTLVSQLILFSTTPILSRFFSPAEFGLYGVLMSIAALATGGSTGKYELAIVKLNRMKAVATSTVLFLSIFFLLLFFIIFIVLSFTFSWSDGTAFFFIDNYFILFFLFIGVSSFNVLIYFFHANSKLQHVVQLNIVRSVLHAILPILILYFFKIEGALIFGTLLSYLISVLIVVKFYNGRVIQLPNFKWSNRFLSKYSDLPKYTLPHFIVDKSRDFILIAGTSYFFGVEIGGVIAVAQRLLSAPAQILSKSLTVFIYKYFFDEKGKGKAFVTYLIIAFFLTSIAIIMFLVFLSFSSELISILLGGAWVKYSNLMVAISIWYFSSFVGGVFAQIPVLYNKSKSFLFLNIVFFILFFLSFFVASDVGVEDFFFVLSSLNFLFVFSFMVWVGMLIYKECYG